MAGESVLLVEDEAGARSFLEQQLADDGFAVVSADRGGRALELVEDSAPDLVLLDAVLPDASGFEVCRRLREGEPGRAWNRDVPVIMLTARGDPIDRLRGFARGCDDYVVRPFVYEELVARMRAVLRRTAPARPTRPAGRRAARGRPALAERARRGRAGPARVEGVRAPRRARRASRSVSSARRSCSATSGASAAWAGRGRSTRTRAGYAAS